ncbi:MAG: hypothetical protein B7Z37_16220 [Verrucomicrobia bacterium 12-59-8]|nr:MAG: hypothetical protein B7Z37_16220 [Verrucomicrobia bacterium 12-59-8]
MFLLFRRHALRGTRVILDQVHRKIAHDEFRWSLPLDLSLAGEKRPERFRHVDGELRHGKSVSVTCFRQNSPIF